MPLQLAFSSNAYLDVPVEQAIQRIAGFGYRGIELLADVPHAWPAGLLPVQKEAIRTALEKNNLTISNINAFMMNAIADPRQPYWLCGSPPNSARRRSPLSRAANWRRARAAPPRPIFSMTRSCPASTWLPSAV